MTSIRGRFQALHPVQRAAVVVWVAVAAAVFGRVAVSKPWSGSVMPIYLNAGQRWIAGEDIYATAIDPGPPPRWLDVYRNPPGVAAAFAALTPLPEKAAGLAFRGVSLALFLTGLGAWLRHGLTLPAAAGRRPPTPAEVGWVFLLSAPLALASLNNGQTNLGIIGGLLHGVAAVARHRYVSGAAWLVGGGLVKLYPLCVGLLLAVARPRRLGPWLAGFAVAWFALPYLTQRPDYVTDMYRSFGGYLGADDRTFADLHRAPKDLFLILRVWTGPPPVAAYKAFVLAVAAGMAGLMAVVAWRRAGVDVPSLALHLGCIWMTALGPATEGATYTILAPTAAAVLVETWAGRGGFGGWGRFALAAAGNVLLVSPVVRDMFPNGIHYQNWGPQPAGGLVLLAAVAWGAVARLGQPAEASAGWAEPAKRAA